MVRDDHLTDASSRPLVAFLGLAGLVLGVGGIASWSLAGGIQADHVLRTCMELLVAGTHSFRSFVLAHPTATAVLFLVAGSLTFALVRAVASVWSSRRLSRRYLPIGPGSKNALFPLLQEEPELAGTLRIGESPTPEAFTAGYLRPWVGLSEGLLARLDQEELRAVLLHELAHLRRRDPLRLLLVRFLRDFLWFLPVAQSLSSTFTDATEEAADDWAAHRRANPLSLASAIVKAAQGSLGPGPAGMAALHGALSIEDRVERLLNGGATTGTRISWTRLVSTGMILMLLILGAIGPTLASPAQGPAEARSPRTTSLMCELPVED